MTGTTPGRSIESRPRDRRSRAQANLIAMAVALVVLTTVLGLAIGLADTARVSGERDSADRDVAVTLADTLVAADGPTTRREAVLDRNATFSLTPETVEAAVPSTDGRDVRIRIHGESIESRTLIDHTASNPGVSDDTGGSATTTVRRSALLAADDPAEPVHLNTAGSLTVDAGTRWATIRVVSGNVTTVRSNGRVVLHRPGGIDGPARVDLPRRTDVELTVEGMGVVAVTVGTESRMPVVLEVTVGET